MPENTPTLGKLVEGNPGRDAVHVAIVPVTAGEDLQPGDRVALTNGLAYLVGEGDAGIGIVDPFLTGEVKKGQRFYLCLYPGTITGLRHVWTHSAFKVKAPEVQQ